ncbi:alpha-glucosidase C-terminal domain-containing protein [bacterium]|nr:alpha-glucosidase C-terminal domain-containing protein [bacterium]
MSTPKSGRFGCPGAAWIPLFVVVVMMSVLSPVRGQSAKIEGEWKFKYDTEDIGVDEGWFAPDHDDAEWNDMAVPAEWDEEYDGVGWYRRTIMVEAPEDAEAKTVLRFGQVDDEAWVYIDGELATSHHSWNTPFWLDLGPYLKKGEPTTLNLAVRVNDVGGPGGILKPVEVVSVVDEMDLYLTEWSEIPARSTLADLGDLVMYSVYIRNFSESGDFEGLRERLPELEAMGVNILWLLPIHPIGEQERKGTLGSPYAISDYYAVNPDFGTKEDFQRLVDEAHAHGMKVIIDLVLNHTSPDSVLTREHPDWFIRNEEGKMTASNPDWYDIVDLDWDNHEVWEYCAEMMEYWVRDLDIDGYRCDVASLMPTPFWEMARARLDRIKPGEIVMLAESEAADLHVKAFDLTYNWPLLDVGHDVINGELSAKQLRSAILSQQYGYPRYSVHMNFVENHDRERALNVYGGPDQAKLGAVLSVTIPGMPLLYTGTEVGCTDLRNDGFFDRKVVDFTSDPHGMRAFWTSILALREQHEALKYGDFQLLNPEPADKALAFTRTHSSGNVLVIANLKGEETTVELEHELLPGNKVTLGPWQWTVLGD